jgi:hypothetical protein
MNRRTMTQRKIDAFWTWFAERHPDVAAAYAGGDAQWLAANLTAQVKRIQPKLNW